MPLLSRESPCIGFCSTVYGDDVCRGCNRYFEEVIHWEKITVEQRNQAIERIHTVLQIAVDEFVRLIDIDKLNAQLNKHKVPIPGIDSPQARIFALLHFGSPFINELSAYGLAATASAEYLTAQEIKLAIVQRRVELSLPGYQGWLSNFIPN